MKALTVVLAVIASVALVSASAEAASKKREVAKHVMKQKSQPSPGAVYDYDGTYLGQDPDPFIRLMIKRQGKFWHSTS